MKVGSHYLGNGVCEFTLWATSVDRAAVHIVSPEEKVLPMIQQSQGYWQLQAEGIEPGTLYFYQLDGKSDFPDPASCFQPQGVHKASEVVELDSFSWQDSDWNGVALEEMIIYELHVGTFTPEGTFRAILPRLSDLAELGVNAIEIMPVAQFPGDRNWGYDGVYPYAVQNSYGRPEELQQLVDEAHQQGIAVILDVVYNHFGPEGNYTSQYAPYFTDTYKTPWGEAINFDNAYCYGVRNYFLENVLYWLKNYHIDGLRLDAVHAIYDLGGKHILQEMAEEVAKFSQEAGRKFYLIAESDLNDVRLIVPRDRGGYGLDAQWGDDFHHALRSVLTKDLGGYYQDFGTCEHLAKAYQNPFVYDWQYSQFRQRYHGSNAGDRPGSQFVVCNQNHDQIGNRMLGERLTDLIDFEATKLAAGVLLLSPYIPLLFMGQEYGEQAPFLYFVSHGDRNLAAAVSEGRRKEFADFHSEGEFIDPQSESAFEKSKLNWQQKDSDKYQILWQLYKQLIVLRRTIPALKKLDRQSVKATDIESDRAIALHRWQGDSHIFCLLNFGDRALELENVFPTGNWQKILDSAAEKWLGNGSDLPDAIDKSNSKLLIKPNSFAVYERR